MARVNATPTTSTNGTNIADLLSACSIRAS